jgi:hypothetical protein
MEPAAGFTMPVRVLSIVVLPDPLPPRSATIEPCGISNVTSRNTSVIP